MIAVVWYCRSPHSGTVDSGSQGMLHVDLHGDDDATGDLNAAAALNLPSQAESAESPMPQSTATQSAIYEAPGEDGRPIYRGFQDPQTQSQTFKKLQSIIASGEGKKSQPIGPCLERSVGYTCSEILRIHTGTANLH